MALNMMPGRLGRKGIVDGVELGIGQGHYTQLNPDTWAIQVQYWSYTHTYILICTCKQESIEMLFFSVLNFCTLFCKTCVSLGHLASKITASFHAFQIEIEFLSRRRF